MKQNQLIIVTLVLIFGGFGIAAVLYQSKQAQETTEQVAQNQSALVRMHSPRMGNPNAKVTIVEFLDPACETCKQFHPLVKQIIEQHKDKVNLVIRYAPLHPGSDQMVKILDGARKQGKFWEVLFLMFETQEHWASHHSPKPEVFWGYLKLYEFDVAALRVHINTPGANAVLKQEIIDGQALGANKTPTFFVNGKALPYFGYKALKELVQSEVTRYYQ